MDNSIINAAVTNDVEAISTILQSTSLKNLQKSTLIIPANILQRNTRNAKIESQIRYWKPVAVLHVAAFFNSLDVFKFLIERGMNLRQPSAELYYPLHYACLNNSLDIVRYILEKDPLEIHESNQAPKCFICCAVSFDSIDVLQLLLEKGAKHCCKVNPLSLAIGHYQMGIFKKLYEAGIRHTDHYSPLMQSVINRNESCVQYLLENGEDPYYIAENHQTALSHACFDNQENIVKLLCNHMDVVDIDPNLKQKAAVHWICWSRNPEIVRTVLAKGIDVNRRDENGHSGPYYLCDYQNEDHTIDILEQLLHAGFDVNGEGVPILYEFLLAIRAQIKVIAWLLDHGADPTAFIPGSNETIYGIVIKRRKRDIVRLFEQYQNDPLKSVTNRFPRKFELD